MALVIPQSEATAFKATLNTPAYAREERDYKVAIHRVMVRLLAPEVVSATNFPETLGGELQNLPDYDSLGIDQATQQSIEEGFATSRINGVRGALTNLSGGRFGLAQFLWIPRAIEFGLGDGMQQAFLKFMNKDRELPLRIDEFRKDLLRLQSELRDRGGFLEHWNLLPISLSFIAALLGAYDPERFTFYAATPLRAAHEAFGVPWPRGTAGVRYQRICEFVIEVGEALRDQTVPVRDLIDAQSFIWLRAIDSSVGRETSGPALPPPPTLDRPKSSKPILVPRDDSDSIDLANLQLEISRRRNAVEMRLRTLLRDGLRFAYGPRAAERALACLAENRRGMLLQYSYGERWHYLYFNELIAIIEREWPCFQHWFSEEKAKVLLWLDTVNRLRIDAHARSADEEELAFLRVCFRRLERILADT